MADKKNNKKVVSMPYSVEAEEALLGAFLMDRDAANDYVPILTAEQFYLPTSVVIFNAMTELFAAGKPIDVVTVMDILEKQGKDKDAGGIEYLNQIVENYLGASNISTYRDILQRDYLTRKVIESGKKIYDYGLDNPADGEGALKFAEKSIFDISEKMDTSSLMQVAPVSGTVIERMMQIQQGVKEDVGIKSGFQNLDDVIGGFRPGTYSILAARPGVGKTAYALAIAVYAACSLGKKVAIFNLEMSMEEIVSRLFTIVSGIPKSVQDRPHAMTQAEIERAYKAHALLCNSGLYVDDSAQNTPAKILSKCRRMKVQHGLDLVIVDYLQLMTLGSESGRGRREASRQEEVSTMSRSMKIFAKELQVPMLVPCQLNRAGEARNASEPRLSDLRESGTIEQDADLVMFLQPYKAEDESGKAIVSAYPQENVVELFVKKNRHGRQAKLAYEWTGDLLKFAPIEVPDVAAFKPVLKGTEKGDEQLKKVDKAPIKVNKEITAEDIGLPSNINNSADSATVLNVKEESVSPLPSPESFVDTGDDFVEESFGNADNAYDDVDGLNIVPDTGDVPF